VSFWKILFTAWLGIPDPESGTRKHIPGIPDLFPGVNISTKIPAQECLAGARTCYFQNFWSVCQAIALGLPDVLDLCSISSGSPSAVTQ
jgi:hypothetical protein